MEDAVRQVWKAEQESSVSSASQRQWNSKWLCTHSEI